MGRLALVCVVVSLAAVVAVLAYVNTGGIAPAELERRCAAIRPAWQSYQEDIKAIGAGPVAAWRGEPVRLEWQGAVIRLTFRLSDPWSGYSAMLPILLRDPLGREYCSVSGQREGGLRTYTFELETASAGSSLPWVEIQYPHTARRLPLDSHGVWDPA